jgi:EmrB/QacA subfamily drug resistance transporter
MTRRQVSPWAALGALCIGFFMIMLDTTIVNVAVPTMLRSLNAGLNQIIWVTSVYLLTYAVPLLLTGRLGDRIGRKPMFLAGLAVFTLSSLWCGLSGNADLLIAARAVQGLGASMMTPQTMAFITSLFPPEKRGAPMGMWGVVAGVATIAGPLLGGALVSLGWQWIFMVNVPIGVVGFVLTVVFVPGGQPRRTHRFDVLGTALSGLGLLALVFGVQNGQQYHWGRVFGPVTIGEIIGAGVVLMIAFGWWQRVNRNEPLVPPGLFRHRNFSLANLANVAIGFALTGMFLPLVIYVQSVLGLSPLMSGVLTAPMSLVSGIVAPFAGRLSDRISGKFVSGFGFLAIAIGVGILALQTGPAIAPVTLIPGLLVCGLGVGCVFSPLANLATRDVEPPMMGAASGVFNTFRQVGSVIGSAAVGVLLQARLTVSMPAAAIAQSANVPAPYRDRFLSGMASAANSATEFGGGGGPKLPPSVPPDVAARIGQAAAAAFRTGFTDATRATLLLPLAVLVAGLVACALMAGRRRTPTARPEPSLPVGRR